MADRSPTPEIPYDEKNPSGLSELDIDSNVSKIEFKSPVPPEIADILVHHCSKELLPEIQIQIPSATLDPVFNQERFLIALDFHVPLSDSLQNTIRSRIRRYLYEIHQEMNGESRGIHRKPGSSQDLTSFTEMLGTYKIRITRIYIPLLICIFAATFLAWLTTYPADVEVNAAIVDPEESSIWGIILNGLVPVLMSAAFITVIWLVVKKFGLNVFKVLMGAIVLFYVWFGFVFYVDIFYIIGWEWMDEHLPLLWVGVYYGAQIVSAIILIYVGYKFFKGSLGVGGKNLLVLLFGIFLGSIIGISFPTWTTFSFAIFLSLWDLYTVFKGPLGKIANVMLDNRNIAFEAIKQQLESGEISEQDAAEMGYYASVHNREEEEEDLKAHLDELEIELGSGDLILYSALVAHTFINTLNWFVTALVIVGVLMGAALTLYYLISKKRILPALPFSMLFGIIMYFIGQGLVLLF